MDPFTIAATAVQIGTILESASSKARAEREQQKELIRKKAELTTRTNINIQNRKEAGLNERADIHNMEASSGFVNSDSQYLAKSMDTEFYDIENANRELAWEKRTLDQEISQSKRKESSIGAGSILSVGSSLLSLGADSYKNSPEFRKAVDNFSSTQAGSTAESRAKGYDNTKNWWE